MADQDPQLEAADNPERPEWLPENFDTPEDLAKSYVEAQRKITETSQTLAEERRAREALEESVQALTQQFEAQNRPDPNQVYSQWQELYDQDPVAMTYQIAQATAQQILQQQAQQPVGPDPDLVARVVDYSMGQKYEDWNQYKEKVAERIAQDPVYARDDLWTNPDAAERALTSIFHVVKAEDVLAGNTVVQQQAADTRAMKLQSQSMAGASGRTPVPPEDEWAQVMKMAREEKRYYS
jgi:hypothetical protein